jgi:ribosomal-protein-alanine N-acetyltransferase
VLNPPEIIETESLRLRKPVLHDAEAIFRQYAQDPEVTKYLTWHPNRSVAETREFVRLCIAAWDAKKSFQWAIIQKKRDQLIGMIGLRIDGHKWELGYVLARRYWGRGYMTEAVKALVNWGLKQPEVYRIWAVCDVENPASARVMEKAGMKREGILRRWSVHPNISAEPRDSYCYAITR